MEMADRRGHCDLHTSMGGVCGLVKSSRDGVPEPSKLTLLGSLAMRGVERFA